MPAANAASSIGERGKDRQIARHCSFVIRLCRPYRAKTKGKVERFNGYLRRSFYVPLAAQLRLLQIVTTAYRQWIPLSV